jgi:hypothetical protein
MSLISTATHNGNIRKPQAAPSNLLSNLQNADLRSKKFFKSTCIVFKLPRSQRSPLSAYFSSSFPPQPPSCFRIPLRYTLLLSTLPHRTGFGKQPDNSKHVNMKCTPSCRVPHHTVAKTYNPLLCTSSLQSHTHTIQHLSKPVLDIFRYLTNTCYIDNIPHTSRDIHTSALCSKSANLIRGTPRLHNTYNNG